MKKKYLLFLLLNLCFLSCQTNYGRTLFLHEKKMPNKNGYGIKIDESNLNLTLDSLMIDELPFFPLCISDRAAIKWSATSGLVLLEGDVFDIACVPYKLNYEATPLKIGFIYYIVPKGAIIDNAHVLSLDFFDYYHVSSLFLNISSCRFKGGEAIIQVGEDITSDEKNKFHGIYSTEWGGNKIYNIESSDFISRKLLVRIGCDGKAKYIRLYREDSKPKPFFEEMLLGEKRSAIIAQGNLVVYRPSQLRPPTPLPEKTPGNRK